MLGNSHNGLSTGNKSWGLDGLGSAYGLSPYADLLGLQALLTHKC